MRIVINAVSWSKLIKGVDRYTIELIRHLAKIDDGNDYFIFHGIWQNTYSGLVDNRRFTFIPIRWFTHRILRHIWHSLIFPFLAYRLKPDIIHLPNTLPLLFKVTKTVISIHDQLLEFSFPEKYGLFRSFARRTIVQMETRKCDRIIVVSPLVKQAVVERLNVKESKMVVIFNGVNTDYFNPSLKLTKSFGIKKPYILFVSMIDRNKNLETLIKAYNMLPVDLKKRYLLIIAGKKGNAYMRVLRIIQEFNLTDNIIFLEHVTEGLPGLYANADVFVMPSYYEGFSLPVLEAMASGTPVILSNTIAIADFVSKGTITFAPDDTNALTEIMVSFLRGEKCAEIIRQKGREIAKSFSWYSTARSTLDVYNQFRCGHL